MKTTSNIPVIRNRKRFPLEISAFFNLLAGGNDILVYQRILNIYLHHPEAAPFGGSLEEIFKLCTRQKFQRQAH